MESTETQQYSETQPFEDRTNAPDSPSDHHHEHRITKVEKSMLKPTRDGNHGKVRSVRDHSNTAFPSNHGNGASLSNHENGAPHGNHRKSGGHGNLKPSSFIIVRPLHKDSKGPPPPPPTILLHRSVKAKGNDSDQTLSRSYPRASTRSKKTTNQSGNSAEKDKDSKDGTRHFARLLHAKAIKLARYKEPYMGDIDDTSGKPESDGDTSPTVKRSPSNVSTVRLSSRESAKRSPRVALTPDTIASTQYGGTPSPRVLRTSSRLSSHSAKTDSSLNISRVRIVRKTTSRDSVTETPATEYATPSAHDREEREFDDQSESTTLSSPRRKKAWRRRYRVSPQRDDEEVPGSSDATSRSITLHWRRQNRVTPASLVINEPWIQDSFDLTGIESLIQKQTERQEERYVQIRIERYNNWLQEREKAMNDKYPIFGHLARKTERRISAAVWAPVRSAPRICERYLSRQGLKRRGPDTEDKNQKARPKTTTGIVKRSGKC